MGTLDSVYCDDLQLSFGRCAPLCGTWTEWAPGFLHVLLQRGQLSFREVPQERGPHFSRGQAGLQMCGLPVISVAQGYSGLNASLQGARRELFCMRWRVLGGTADHAL